MLIFLNFYSQVVTNPQLMTNFLMEGLCYFTSPSVKLSKLRESEIVWKWFGKLNWPIANYVLSVIKSFHFRCKYSSYHYELFFFFFLKDWEAYHFSALSGVHMHVLKSNSSISSVSNVTDRQTLLVWRLRLAIKLTFIWSVVLNDHLTRM